MVQLATINQSTFHVGDTVEVHYRIFERRKVAGKTKGEVKEEQKERIQIFEGVVIAIRGSGNGKNFIVRRIGADSIGIERIFPIMSPWIKTVIVKKHGDVRRAKLYYIRAQHGTEANQVKELTHTSTMSVKPHEHVAKRKLRRKTGRSAPKK